MQIVLLCGGMGKRLRALSKNIPKGMIEINKKPFIYYLLKSLEKFNFTSIHFCLGYKSEIFIGYLNSINYHIPISYSLENSEKLLGTGGAIVNAFKYLNRDFIIQYGDTLLDINYELFFKKHILNHSKITMSVIPSDICNHKPNIYCTKNVNGELNCIYDKKNPNINSNYIDYGAMACQKNVFAELDSNFIDLSDIQKEITISGQASFFEIFSPFIEIGNPQALNLAKNILKND